MTFTRESDVVIVFSFVKYEISFLFQNVFSEQVYIYLGLGIFFNNFIRAQIFNAFNKLK